MNVSSIKYIRGLVCFPEIHNRIAGGESVTHIARDLVSRGTIDDLEVAQLVYRLRVYRKNMSKLELVAPYQPKVVEEALEQIERSLEEMDALENLYAIQTQRLQRFLEEEFDGDPNPAIAREMQLAVQILDKRHSIKMDLGYQGGRDLGTMTIRPELAMSVEQAHGEAVARVLNTPKKRAKVLSLAQRFIRYSAKTAGDNDLIDPIDVEVEEP